MAVVPKGKRNAVGCSDHSGVQGSSQHKVGGSDAVDDAADLHGAGGDICPQNHIATCVSKVAVRPAVPEMGDADRLARSQTKPPRRIKGRQEEGDIALGCCRPELENRSRLGAAYGENLSSVDAVLAKTVFIAHATAPKDDLRLLLPILCQIRFRHQEVGDDAADDVDRSIVPRNRFEHFLTKKIG